MNKVAPVALALVTTWIASPRLHADEEKRAPLINLKVSLGAAYRSLYDTTLGTGLVDFSLGHDFARQPVSLYLDATAQAGGFSARMPMIFWSLGPTVEARLQRLRFGAGPQFGMVFVRRATTGQFAQGATIGLHAVATFDFVRLAMGAFFAGLDGGLNWAIFRVQADTGYQTTGVPCLALILGFRLGSRLGFRH